MLIKRVLYSSGDPRNFKNKTAIARADQARAVQHKMMTKRLEKRALFITKFTLMTQGMGRRVLYSTKFTLYGPISQSLCHQSTAVQYPLF